MTPFQIPRCCVGSLLLFLCFNLECHFIHIEMTEVHIFAEVRKDLASGGIWLDERNSNKQQLLILAIAQLLKAVRSHDGQAQK